MESPITCQLCVDQAHIPKALVLQGNDVFQIQGSRIIYRFSVKLNPIGMIANYDRYIVIIKNLS
jgi:hypothetical protein